MKLKATSIFKNLDNKFFGVHKVKKLEAGGVVEVTSPDNIPTEVMATLEEVGKKKVVKKTTKGDK
jgi:trans-aconitate methyltransferase